MERMIEEFQKYNIEKYFNQIKGNECLGEEEKESAYEVLQKLKRTCNIKRVSKVYPSQEFRIDDAGILFDRASIYGELFAKDCFRDAISVMVFLITVSEIEEDMITNVTREPQVDLLSQYYETMWKYAALQGCRNDIAEEYKTSRSVDDRGVFTPVLGPGYFGIDLIENRKLYELLDGKEMGIVINDKNQFISENTICGFVIELKSLTEECRNMFNNPCCYCLATKKSCGFCDYDYKE